RDLIVTGVQTCALPILAFVLTNGASPSCGLIQARDGNLYGTAMGGGPGGFNGYGTIFRLSIPSAAAPKLRAPGLRETDLGLAWRSEERRVGKECRRRRS